MTQSLHRSLERAIHERIEAAKGRVLTIPALIKGRKEGCLSTLFLRCFVPCASRIGECCCRYFGRLQCVCAVHVLVSWTQLGAPPSRHVCLCVWLALLAIDVQCAGLLRVRVTRLADDWETAETPAAFYGDATPEGDE